MKRKLVEYARKMYDDRASVTFTFGRIRGYELLYTVRPDFNTDGHLKGYEYDINGFLKRRVFDVYIDTKHSSLTYSMLLNGLYDDDPYNKTTGYKVYHRYLNILRFLCKEGL